MPSSQLAAGNVTEISRGYAGLLFGDHHQLAVDASDMNYRAVRMAKATDIAVGLGAGCRPVFIEVFTDYGCQNTAADEDYYRAKEKGRVAISVHNSILAHQAEV